MVRLVNISLTTPPCPHIRWDYTEQMCQKSDLQITDQQTDAVIICTLTDGRPSDLFNLLFTTEILGLAKWNTCKKK